MKLTIFILSNLSWNIINVASEICSKPVVYKSTLHIFRTADVDVTVYHCYYDNKYSDISKNCITAFNTGLYIDKWKVEYFVNATDSKLKLKKYTAKANIIQNEIQLKSGTVCRYDREFCYDPKESIDFAVVWEVAHEETDINAKNLIEVFFGPVDIWLLRNESAIYLVFQDTEKDQSFAFRLEKSGILNGKRYWYADRYGVILFEESFKENVTHFWNKEYFPLKPKQFVSEEILRNCDLQKFPLNFEKNTYQNDILNPNNLLAILKIFQTQLLETNEKLTVIENKENSMNKTFTELQNNLRDIETSLLAKEQEMAEIRGTIKNMFTTLSKKDKDVSKLQEEIKQMFLQQQNNDVDLGKIEEKVLVLQNQLSKLGDDSNGKIINNEFKKLVNNFTFLETTLLEKNTEIFKALYNKGGLIDDIQNRLFDLSQELRNKDIDLQKGQENASNRLYNIELELNRQNNNITKFQNHTQQKDEQISQIQGEMIKEDAEIKILYEYFKKIDEKCKDTENKLKERDDEMRRKDEEFHDELNKKNQEYKKLGEKIKQIEEFIMRTVDVN